MYIYICVGSDAACEYNVKFLHVYVYMCTCICDRPREKGPKTVKIVLELMLDFEFAMHFEPLLQLWSR